jgi:hypothetical protein
MDDGDLRGALAQCQLGKLEAGAESELRNWSGGFPPLLLALLNAVEAQAKGAAVSAQTVNSAAEQAFADVQDVLAQLWDECSEETRDVYRELIDAGSMPIDGVGWEQRERLEACGFATKDGSNRLRKACRLLERFVARRPDQGSVARLFHSADGYRANIRSILELRLRQLGAVDGQLRRALEKSIQDLPDYPTEALGNMRNIAARCFALIWSCELGAGWQIPAELFGYWSQYANVDRFQQLRVPGELRPQCRLLQLLVGAEQKIDRRARHFSRQTYHLLNAVVDYGHYGQHTEGEQVELGTAVAAVMTSLELVARLAEEHPQAP